MIIFLPNSHITLSLKTGKTLTPPPYPPLPFCPRYVKIDIQYTWDQKGSKGIRQLPINCSTSQMMIHKFTPSVDYN